MSATLRSPDVLELVTPVAFRLVDSMTGAAPIRRIVTILEEQTSPGNWTRIAVEPTYTASGFLIFPKLDKRAHALGQPARKYRFKIDTAATPAYLPAYGAAPATADGIEFDSFPYNDDALPPTFANHITDVVLFPSPRYPFNPNTPVLRGYAKRTGTNERVAGAEVMEGVHDRTLTDAAGEFALPLRQVAPHVNTVIDVTDQHSTPNQTGVAVIQIPLALGIAHTIALT